MPVSSTSGKPAIVRLVNRLRPKNALDIGCGSGTYAKLFPDLEMDGVEIWEPYIDKYNLTNLYKNLTIIDAREWNPEKHWDVAFAGDVLEHMTVNESQNLLKKLKNCADTVIVSIPLGNHPQGECEGNPFERHVKDDWTHEAIIEAFGAPSCFHIDGFIGVYVWSIHNVREIPNKIHMIWFSGDNSRPFSFINYLAVRAAKEIQNPNSLTIYYNEDLPDNPHWQAAKDYATFVKVDKPTEFRGVPLTTPQYQSDVFRLLKLYEEGGIYLDTDAILTKPLTPLLDAECVLNVDHKNKVIANGIMLTQAKHQFFARWIDKLAENLTNPAWAYHAVVLPYQLYTEKKDNISEYPTETFLPFGWENKAILDNDPSALPELDYAYCIHMWETMWPEVAQIDNQYLLESDSVFAQAFRKYAKKKLKICVYAISKNEEKFVKRFCESAKPGDMILIADTGSTDDTVSLAKECGAYVPEICISPWRFDDARNAALALIPKDMDICVSLDLDEELQPGWREEIERVWVEGTTRLKYKFDWGAGIAFYYEKIHGRKGYRWTHPCHEYPVPYMIEEKYAWTDMLMVIHKPDPTKSRGQYLPLLEMSVKEDPIDPRNAFYYARELSFHSRWADSIRECERYLALPGANWPNERCYAYRVMARCYEELGDWDKAIRSARLASVEAPGTREPWCEIAKLTYRRQQWAECYGAAMTALAITNREWVYTVDPEVWGALPHDYASISAWWLGLKDQAIEQAKLAVSFKPDDARLKNNLELMIAARNS